MVGQKPVWDNNRHHDWDGDGDGDWGAPGPDPPDNEYSTASLSLSVLRLPPLKVFLDSASALGWTGCAAEGQRGG